MIAIAWLCYLASACGVVVGWWSFFKARTFSGGFINLFTCLTPATVFAVLGLWLEYTLS